MHPLPTETSKKSWHRERVSWDESHKEKWSRAQHPDSAQLPHAASTPWVKSFRRLKSQEVITAFREVFIGLELKMYFIDVCNIFGRFLFKETLVMSPVLFVPSQAALPEANCVMVQPCATRWCRNGLLKAHHHRRGLWLHSSHLLPATSSFPLQGSPGKLLIFC